MALRESAALAYVEVTGEDREIAVEVRAVEGNGNGEAVVDGQTHHPDVGEDRVAVYAVSLAEDVRAAPPEEQLMEIDVRWTSPGCLRNLGNSNVQRSGPLPFQVAPLPSDHPALGLASMSQSEVLADPIDALVVPAVARQHNCWKQSHKPQYRFRSTSSCSDQLNDVQTARTPARSPGSFCYAQMDETDLFDHDHSAGFNLLVDRETVEVEPARGSLTAAVSTIPNY